MSSRSPRIAHGVFCRADRDGLLTERVMDRRLRRSDLDEGERAGVRDIVHGVLRHRGLLDHLLQHHSKIPLNDLERAVIQALRIGAYRCLFQTRSPRPVAVKETVDLLPGRRSARTRGFVNAVLRALCRTIGDPLGEAPPVPKGPRDLPFADGGGVRLRNPVLPDPQRDLGESLSVIYSHPRWLVDRWIDGFGREAAVDALRAGCGKAPLSIRANRLRTTRDDLLGRLRRRGFEAEPGAAPGAIRVLAGRSLLSAPEFRAGLFYVQDETPMRVASLLDLRPGLRVLDLCAAPGGKSTQIAEAMENDGEVLACDISEVKLERIEENCRRLGVRIVSPVLLDPAESSLPIGGSFDRVVVDVPCSNSGVFRRRPEARWRIRPETIAHLHETQARLLAMAARRLAPGGVLLYSTCSLEPEENRNVVGEFLDRHPDLLLREDDLVMPRPGGPDGGYMARIEGTGS